MLDFFTAAAETTQNASQTFINHWIKDNNSLQKVREEFEQIKEREIAENPEYKDLSKEELMSKIVNMENCQDMSYLNCVIQETLRFEPPATGVSHIICLEDVTLGKYQFKKGDLVQPYMRGL